MKKKAVSVLVCAAMVAVLAAGCGNSSSSGDTGDTGTTSDSSAAAAESTDDSSTAAVENTGETYTLRVQSHDPEASATGTFLKNWAAAVTEASGGQLDIQVFHGGTLGGPADTLDLLRNGAVEIGWGLQNYFTDVFPVTEVFQLPMIPIESTIQGSTAIWNFYNDTDYMDEEYSEFHVLFLHTNCQSPISTVNKKIESVSDLKGLQLRANAGPPNDFIEALGATPVSIKINDLYSELEKANCDGSFTDWHAISSFSLYEVLNYMLDENVGVSTYFLLMNQDSYDSLPSDLQTILDETSSDSVQYTSAWDDVATSIKEQCADKIYNLSDDERTNLQSVADQVIADWIKKMTDEKGYDGQAIYDKAMEYIANAAQ